MRRLALLATATLAAMAAPAAATVVVYNGTNFNAGNVIQIHFDGLNTPSAQADLSLTFQGVNSTTGDLNFLFSLTNSSTSPSSNDNASAFGFDITAPGFTFSLGSSSVTTTGDLTNVRSGSISGGFFVDYCATTGNTCSGGQNQGPRPGETQTGSFILAFNGNTAPGTVTLSQPIVRFQNTVPTGSDVAVPGPGGVPEPGTWAMMLVGFGAAGVAMRRRRRPKALTQLA